MKAVIETSEWLTATANTVELWGDNTLERLSLHANLERLKSLQISLPEEQPKVDNLRACGLKIIRYIILFHRDAKQRHLGYGLRIVQGSVSLYRNVNRLMLSEY